MILPRLAYHSLKNRKFTTILTITSIAISVALLLGVEKTRLGARDSFNNTISQTDLIIGARSGPIQLLLYAVFHMGDATNNISYQSYLHYKNDPRVEWTIPYSLGDSHRGFRVVATSEEFYQHYHYRQDHGLVLAQGKAASDVFDVVLGADVAKQLHYQLGQEVVLSHGVSDGGGLEHSDKPFHVVGILDKTATPIDRSLYITLEGMEAIHIDWQSGAPPLPGHETPVEKIKKENIKVEQITAFLLRTKSRIQAIYLEREVDTYEGEPLLAIIPGVALSQLWQGISYAEDGLRLITVFVVLSGFLGMLIALYTSLNERRREMAILRAVGAGPRKILFLLVLESTFLTLSGIITGTGLVYLLLSVGQPIIERQFGLYLPIKPLSMTEWIYLSATFGGGTLIGLVPAWKAFKNALADGLTIRV
ncbi:MAG: ABC transporter permease [Oligoflexia bacterium]|nr:ABC transporter permease [Oligoflexia bacterium]